MGYHVKYKRVYAALKRVGHTPAKALELLIDASRGDRLALLWVRTVCRHH